MEDMVKIQYNKFENVENKGQIDFARTARAERLYKSLWSHVYALYKQLPPEMKTVRDKERAILEMAKTRPEVEFFLKLELSLYPFLHLHPRRTSLSLYESYTGRGVVICAGNNQFEFIVSSIQAIRLLNPALPIEVFYMGDEDLSPERQMYVREMTQHIELKDVYKYLENDEMMLGGWSVKAFALLASSFAEVMLIDSDAYFLKVIWSVARAPSAQILDARRIFHLTNF